VEGLPPEFNELAEVWQVLKTEHYDREHLDAKAMTEGAIRGMLRAMDDPYASFLTAEQFAVESQDFKGYFGGIGAEVGVRNKQITILAPLPGAPAELAGIQPGDVILEIDGKSAAGISLLEAVSRIRGEKGTRVELLIYRSA
jgi:carboxyl-terminal processing protease